MTISDHLLYGQFFERDFAKVKGYILPTILYIGDVSLIFMRVHPNKRYAYGAGRNANPRRKSALFMGSQNGYSQIYRR